MHDIWNPWHGCVKCSEGCQNCYMFCGTGRRFVKDGKTYKLEGSVQTQQAYKSGLSFEGNAVRL